VSIDPGEGGSHSEHLYPLVVGYAVYSGVVAPRVRAAAPLYLNRLQIVAHAIDSTVFSAFIRPIRCDATTDAWPAPRVPANPRHASPA
jgi:hypothetical protein